MEFIAQFFDIILHLDKHLAALLAQYGNWIYAILFLIVFCETGLVVAPFLPGDSLLFVSGALAAAGGMDIGILCAVLFVAAVVGDNVNYWIGRYFGLRILAHEKTPFFNREAFENTKKFFAEHGGKTIIIARFLPFARTFAPFVAGVAHMHYPRYVVLDVMGGMLWIGSLCMAGYWFGNLPLIKNNLSLVIFSIIGITLLPVVAGYVKQRLGNKAA